MLLNPDIEAFLDLADASRDTVPALHQLPVNEARALFAQTTRQLRWAAPSSVKVEALDCQARDGQRIGLRLYRPDEAVNGPLPVLLFLHGGGFVLGSLDSHDGICREFAARAQCAVMAVDYRLAPEHKFPTALHDAADALAWLAEHASALGLDARRVVVGGDSAGATLATVLAIQAVHEPAAVALKPVGQLLCYPVTDAALCSESRELFSEGYLLESATLEWFYQHYQRDEDDRQDWRFSPLRAPQLQGVAPAVIALAGFDPLLDEGHAYARRLVEQGAAVQVLEYGLTHDFLRMGVVTSEIEGVYAELATLLRALFQVGGAVRTEGYA